MKTEVFVLVLVIALSACAQAGTANPTPTLILPTTLPIDTPQATTIDTKNLSVDLDAMIQEFVKLNVFSGSVLVAQNGQVILSNGYGFADREKNISNTAQTKFRIYSITKQFTAMAILMLQEQGKLSVQDDICKYIVNCPEDWKPITIHQLLTHTSGIPDTIATFMTQEITSTMPLELMIKDVVTKPLDFQPGTKWSYDNIGYILLGKIIETASGQSYESFLQKNIFEPLQMKNTGYDHNRDDLAIGYTNQFKDVANPINMWVVFSAGALYSTVEDLYLWDQALYTNKLVPQEALDAMFMVEAPIPDSGGGGYGYGWYIGPANERRLITHEGTANGYSATIRRYPDDHATIIMLFNQENIDLNTTADMIAMRLFGDK